METSVKSALIIASVFILVSCETMQSPPATGGPPTLFCYQHRCRQGRRLGRH